ncbi:MAG: adenylate/guanylate cyclase domain-containing protein [Actinomycetota bacterium]
MGELTEVEICDRANVESAFVKELVDCGVLEPEPDARPYRAGDVWRTRLAKACVDAGLPLEGIGEAIRRRLLTLSMLDLPQYAHWSGYANETYEQLAERTGLPVEFFAQAHEAAGFPPAAPTDRVREDELGSIPATQIALAFGFPMDSVLRVYRVYGENLRRIAQVESQQYHEHVDIPLQQQGLSHAEVFEQGSAFGEQIMEVLDAALLATYHRHREATWMGDLVEHIEAALDEGGLYAKLDRPPAMVFLDLTGYTKLTEERGDAAAASMARALSSLVSSTARRHGGEAVKFLGDGVMFYFPDPGRAVLASLEMVLSTEEAGLPPAHVGIASGPVIKQDGDYFGRTVNLASRIAGKASSSEVLVSADVAELCGGQIGVEFVPLGPVELKGVERLTELFGASRSD